MNSTLQYGEVIFDNVSKRFFLGTFGTLRGTLAAIGSMRKGNGNMPWTLWAVKDVSFRAHPGDSIGLIGPNGAGKTTTLKLLSNVTPPTKGTVKVVGRRASLIELGAGFHPELTGRENIYLNGTILGLRRKEIEKKLDAIVAFSELEPFLDTPVKRYSSGMYVRLGFSVAAQVEPDVLLVDEVLAVGDASFRHRCIRRMQQLRQNGTTVIFVSHNMHLVREMCDTVILMVDGEIHSRGDSSMVIGEYEKLVLLSDARSTSSPRAVLAANNGSVQMVLTYIAISSPQEVSGDFLASDRPATVNIHYRAAGRQQVGRVVVRVIREDGLVCCTADSSRSSDLDRIMEVKREGQIEVTFNPLQLATGIYSISVRITDPSDEVVVASGQSPNFAVFAEKSDPTGSVFMPNVSWRSRSILDPSDP